MVPPDVVSSNLRKLKTLYISGRSSDLLPCLNAFPSRFIGTVAIEVFVQHVSGAYSSGSVQDLHLIPFSSFISKPYEMNNTKIQGKDRLFFWDLFNKFVKMVQECC